MGLLQVISTKLTKQERGVCAQLGWATCCKSALCVNAVGMRIANKLDIQAMLHTICVVPTVGVQKNQHEAPGGPQNTTASSPAPPTYAHCMRLWPNSCREEEPAAPRIAPTRPLGSYY